MIILAEYGTLPTVTNAYRISKQALSLNSMVARFLIWKSIIKRDDYSSKYDNAPLKSEENSLLFYS